MKNDDWEAFHRGDTLPNGIPVIQIPAPPRKLPVPLIAGLAVGAMVLGGLVAYSVTDGPPANQEPVAAGTPREATPRPSVSVSEVPAQSPETRATGGESMSCTGDELPVSSHGTITCATEQEACALGSSYVTLTSNCGLPEIGQLIPAGTYEFFSQGDCLRLVSGRFEDGAIMKVACDPMSAVSATVVSAVSGDDSDIKCDSEDGSPQVFVAQYFSGATNMQTLCLAANK
ncbi:hypothetical protein [Streptomyces sp. NPDC005322]|uniref:LppU/SCO3897 family protein n=1 Tax=Streptomyces sp. NPDC005322 TaxID=3157032 RepID=UPI0033A8533E